MGFFLVWLCVCVCHGIIPICRFVEFCGSELVQREKMIITLAGSRIGSGLLHFPRINSLSLFLSVYVSGKNAHHTIQ